MKRLLKPLLAALAVCVACPVEAIIFTEIDDAASNTVAPNGELTGSGWDFQGDWLSFLGTPLAPQFFITAKHVGGGIGNEFTFRGGSYVTDGFFDDLESD